MPACPHQELVIRCLTCGNLHCDHRKLCSSTTVAITNSFQLLHNAKALKWALIFFFAGLGAIEAWMQLMMGHYGLGPLLPGRLALVAGLTPSKLCKFGADNLMYFRYILPK